MFNWLFLDYSFAPDDQDCKSDTKSEGLRKESCYRRHLAEVRIKKKEVRRINSVAKRRLGAGEGSLTHMGFP